MYKNYGDVNFFDNGMLVQKKGETEFEILACSEDPYNENHYFLSTYDFDVRDINPTTLEDVCKYAGNRSVSIDYTEEEWSILALDCIYYGCTPVEQTLHLTKNEVIDFIDHGYINEIEWEFYESNFYETNRNCVVRICQNDGIGMASTEIYNTLEDALKDFERRAKKGWSIEVIDK